MKHVLTTILTALTGLSTVAQITLNKSDYKLVPGDTAFYRPVVYEGNNTPTLGAIQIWDFSHVPINTFNTIYFDLLAETDTNMSNANIIHREDVGQGLSGSYVEYSNEWYELINELGHATLGKRTIGQAHSLIAQTKHNGDSIIYLDNLNEYEVPFYKVKFPLQYGDSWTSEFTTNVDFKLKLPSISIEEIYGSIRGEAYYDVSIDGWGTLILPDGEGGANYELDALLSVHKRSSQIAWMKQNQSKLFSPIPNAILDLLGINQKVEIEETVYTFWAKNLPGPAFQIRHRADHKDRVLVSANLQNAALNFNIPSGSINNVYLNPNPIKTGQTIYINSRLKLDLTEVQFINMSGMVVFNKAFSPTIRIPPDIIPGMYICQISSKTGKVHSNKRLLIY